MLLKVLKETDTGLNIEFFNKESGRRIELNQAITQINKGNTNYKKYQVVNMANGTSYIRSKPDKSRKNNIED